MRFCKSKIYQRIHENGPSERCIIDKIVEMRTWKECITQSLSKQSYISKIATMHEIIAHSQNPQLKRSGTNSITCQWDCCRTTYYGQDVWSPLLYGSPFPWKYILQKCSYDHHFGPKLSQDMIVCKGCAKYTCWLPSGGTYMSATLHITCIMYVHNIWPWHLTNMTSSFNLGKAWWYMPTMSLINIYMVQVQRIVFHVA